MTDFYDLFVLAEFRPSRTYVHKVHTNTLVSMYYRFYPTDFYPPLSIRSSCAPSRVEGHQRTLRSDPDRVESRPRAETLKWLTTGERARLFPLPARYEIEAGINFTVRRGKETLRNGYWRQGK